MAMYGKDSAVGLLVVFVKFMIHRPFQAHDQMVEAGYMLPFLGAIGTFELYVRGTWWGLVVDRGAT